MILEYKLHPRLMLATGLLYNMWYTWWYLFVCLFAGLLAYPRTLGGTSWSLKTGQKTCIPPSSSLSHPFYTQPTVPVKSYTFIFQFLIHLEPSSHLPIYQVTIDPWFQIYRINWYDPQGCRFGPESSRQTLVKHQYLDPDWYHMWPHPPSTSPGPTPQNVHHPVRCAGTEHQSVPPPPRPDGTSGGRRDGGWKGEGAPQIPQWICSGSVFLVIKKKHPHKNWSQKDLVSDAGGKNMVDIDSFQRWAIYVFLVNSEFFNFRDVKYLGMNFLPHVWMESCLS